jgi:type I restriction enzyme S subunit
VSELPRGWATAKLGDVISQDGLFVDGDWVESKDQDPDGDVRLTQLADVGEGLFRNRSNRFLTVQKARELRCSYLEPSDVLVARMPDPLGRACLFPGDTKPCVTVVDVCIIRPGAKGVDPRWLMWWINAPRLRRDVLALQSGTTRKRISRKNLATIAFPVPPLAEQRRIVAAIEEHFSRLDAAEQSLRRAQRRLERLRDLTVDDALKGNWRLSLTGKVAEVQGGIQKQPKRRPVKNKAPFLRVANVLRGRLDLAEVHEIELFGGELDRYRLGYGDLLVVEGNGSASQIGRSAMWRDEIANCVHQNHLIRVRPGPLLDSKFLDIYWNSASTRRLLTGVASSTSGLYTLNTAKVKAIEVPIPPLPDQRRIVAEVERRLSLVDALATATAAALKRSAALRRSILERAFTGKLVPQDPNDEPASALLERIGAERADQEPHPRARRR